MTGFTYGTYLIYDAAAVPTAGYTLGTEGENYIKFTNKVGLNHNIAPKPGVIDVPGANEYAINLGEVAEKVTVTDIMTRAQYDNLLKFVKTATQTPVSSYLYLVVCTADTPTVMAFYQKSAATTSEYLPCVVEGMGGTWSEATQHWAITVQLHAVW